MVLLREGLDECEVVMVSDRSIGVEEEEVVVAEGGTTTVEAIDKLRDCWLLWLGVLVFDEVDGLDGLGYCCWPDGRFCGAFGAPS